MRAEILLVIPPPNLPEILPVVFQSMIRGFFSEFVAPGFLLKFSHKLTQGFLQIFD